MYQAILFLVLGIALLLTGAEFMVKGAARLAVSLGLSSLFVGLTVVAFATSAPELVVTIQATLRGVPDLAVGNVVGSNICNIAIILGVTALVMPIPCHSTIIRREVPLVIGVTGLFWVFAIGGIHRLEAAVLVAGLIAYIAWTYLSAKRASNPVVEESVAEGGRTRKSMFADLAFIALGLTGLVFGSDLLVDGAVFIAEEWGMSEAVIGLTVVAVGTSLPEVATSIVAARRNQPDLAVGNVMGSNLWNILAVAGIGGTIQGLPVQREILLVDMAFAFLLAVACLPIMSSQARVSRGEGLLLLISYVIFVVLRLCFV